MLQKVPMLNIHGPLMHTPLEKVCSGLSGPKSDFFNGPSLGDSSSLILEEPVTSDVGTVWTQPGTPLGFSAALFQVNRVPSPPAT